MRAVVIRRSVGGVAIAAVLVVAAGCGGTSTEGRGATETVPAATTSTPQETVDTPTETAAPEETTPPETSTPEETTPPETSAPEETTTPTETSTPAKSPKPAPKKMSVVVEGALPVGGIKRFSVKKGATVVLVVSSDVADEIHLHGYDLSRDVAAGGVARITFVAKVPGRFEVELEQRGVEIGQLTVKP